MILPRGNIVFLTDWLPPDFGAVGQYTIKRAEEMARSGDRVLVIGLGTVASDQSFEYGSGGLLRVVRLLAKTYDRSRLSRRIRWTFAVNFKIFRRTWTAMRKADRVILTGHPPLFLHWVAPFKGLMRGDLWYRICDFHPECLTASMSKVPIALRVLTRVTWFWRRRVDHFEALGEDMKQRLIEGGIEANRIGVVRDGSPVAFSKKLEPLPRPEAVQGGPVLLYSGNLGLAHEVKTFVDGYTAHHKKHAQPVRLWLNASGEAANQLEQILSARQLPCYRTQPVPLADLARLLVTPDAHLILLKDAFVGLVLPSKVYACIESGRPIIYVGSRRSDVDLLCRQRVDASAYQQVSMADAVAMEAALNRMADGYAESNQSPAENTSVTTTH